MEKDSKTILMIIGGIILTFLVLRAVIAVAVALLPVVVFAVVLYFILNMVLEADKETSKYTENNRYVELEPGIVQGHIASQYAFNAYQDGLLTDIYTMPAGTKVAVNTNDVLSDREMFEVYPVINTTIDYSTSALVTRNDIEF